MKRSLRVVLLLGLAALLVWLSVDMSGRARQELQWGYRPLLWFLAAWGLVTVLTLSRDPRRRRWLGLATLSGVLLAVGFPDVLLPVPWLLFIGFVPLLWIEREISNSAGSATSDFPFLSSATSRKSDGGSTSDFRLPTSNLKGPTWTVFRYSYQTFVTWNILTTFWVANSALAAGLFAILVNSALMTLPVVLFHRVRRVSPRLGYLPFIVFWIAFEYIHLNWELTWPWLTLGNGFAEWPALVQWYEYTGVFGGTLWILVMNVLCLRWWEQYRDQGAFRRASLIRPALLALLPMLVSLARFYAYQPLPGRDVEVVVVQPNYEPHYEKFAVPERDQVDHFIELASSQVDGRTDYLVFPETSFGMDNLDVAKANFYPAVHRLRRFLKGYPDVHLIAGFGAYQILREGEASTRATREARLPDGDTLRYEALNAATQITFGDTTLLWYRKSKLVPGPEIFPFRRILWFFRPIVKQLGGTWEGVGTQAQRTVFPSPVGRVGTAICYESVFGEYVTGYIRQGAQAIFIITNDGWWDDTPGHRQHLHFASLRAIETRREVVRSANTGISCFIDQRGVIRQATRYNEATAIKDKIRLNDALTFYVRWGDIIARVALLLSGLLLLSWLVRMITGRARPGGRFP